MVPDLDHAPPATAAAIEARLKQNLLYALEAMEAKEERELDEICAES